LNPTQRCDAKRPCTTCTRAERASQCIYENERRPYPAGVRLLYSTGDHPPERQRGGAAPAKISTPVLTDGVFTDILSPAKLELMRSIWLATDEPSPLQCIPHNRSSGTVNPLNDPPSTWPDHSTGGDESYLQSYPHLVPLPYRALQPYKAHMHADIATCPTTPPPIDVSGNHPRDEGWQPNHYGDTSATLLSVASYPQSSFQYPTQHPPQGTLHDPHSSVPANPSATPSTGSLRRDPVSVERTTRRSSTDTITSPYRHYPLVSDTSSDHPSPKQRRNRANAKQARVFNEVYALTTVPPTKQQEELMAGWKIFEEQLEIQYISFLTVSTVRLMSPLAIKTNDGAASQRQFGNPDRR